MERAERIVVAPADVRCTRIGLPHLVWCGGRWITAFERIRAGRFAVFGATSTGGAWWAVTQDGEPLYVASAESWDAFGQASPSLHVSGGRGVIVYDGEATRHAWRGLDRPILRRGPAGAWDAGRLEGARPVLDPADLGRVGLLYFGLPGPDSYAGGALGLAWLHSPTAPTDR